MGPRFFGLNAGQAYNVAGSFCRFLLDTRGADKLERLYRAAGARRAAGSAIYGVDLRRRCATSGCASSTRRGAGRRERAVALERLKRPSVFRVPCAHAQALRKQAARQAAQAGDRARALAEWDAVCADDRSRAERRSIALEADGRRRRRRARAAEALARARRARRRRAARAPARCSSGDSACSRGQPTARLRRASRRCRSRSRRRGWRRSSAIVSRWPASEARTTLLADPGRAGGHARRARSTS